MLSNEHSINFCLNSLALDHRVAGTTDSAFVFAAASAAAAASVAASTASALHMYMDCSSCLMIRLHKALVV